MLDFQYHPPVVYDYVAEERCGELATTAASLPVYICPLVCAKAKKCDVLSVNSEEGSQSKCFSG